MTLQLSWDRAGEGGPLLHGIGSTHADADGFWDMLQLVAQATATARHLPLQRTA